MNSTLKSIAKKISNARAAMSSWAEALAKPEELKIPATLEEVARHRDQLRARLAKGLHGRAVEVAEDQLIQLDAIEVRIRIKEEHEKLLGQLDLDEEAAKPEIARLEKECSEARTQLAAARTELWRQQARLEPLRSAVESSRAAAMNRVSLAEAQFASVSPDDDAGAEKAAAELHEARCALAEQSDGPIHLRIGKVQEGITAATSVAEQAQRSFDAASQALAKGRVAIEQIRANRALVDLTFARSAWQQARSEAGINYGNQPFLNIAEDFTFAGFPHDASAQKFARIPFGGRDAPIRIPAFDPTAFEISLEEVSDVGPAASLARAA